MSKEQEDRKESSRDELSTTSSMQPHYVRGSTRLQVTNRKHCHEIHNIKQYHVSFGDQH